MNRNELFSKCECLIGRTVGEIDYHGKFAEVENANIEGNSRRSTKGLIGQLVEQYFGISPNNIQGPDFQDLKIELKVTAIKKVKNQISAKERLVLSMINYEKEPFWDTIEKSLLFSKLNEILIILYEYDSESPIEEWKFLKWFIYDLNKMTTEDYHIISDDWDLIHGKIMSGKAHEISEGDTFYLGACPKAADGSVRKPQPFSEIPAKPRAFCLKTGYVTEIYREVLGYPIIKPHFNLSKERGIEQTLLEELQNYLGKSIESILRQHNIVFSTSAKNNLSLLSNKILKHIGSRIERLDNWLKEEIKIKNIHLNKNGINKESISFEAIDFFDMLNENWETSYFRNTLAEKKFLLFIYKDNSKGEIFLKEVKLWNMPEDDVDLYAKEVWEKTKQVIQSSSFKLSDLPGMAFNGVCHVRPHGRNGLDTVKLPNGQYITKQSFWINNTYIRKFIIDK